MRLDRWLGPGITLLALVWLWLSYTYIPGARGEGEPGPQAFPIVLGATMLGIGVLITLAAWFRSRHLPPATTVPGVTAHEARTVAGVFALLIFYAFAMEKVGFVIATPLATLLAMRGLLGMRRWPLMLLFSASITALCWLFFVQLLETPLPRGLWLM